MPRIPIDNLPTPPSDTWVKLGHVYAFDVTAPVLVTTNTTTGTVTIEVNHLADNLGDYLPVSQHLSKEQVEDLVKGKTVRL